MEGGSHEEGHPIAEESRPGNSYHPDTYGGPVGLHRGDADTGPDGNAGSHQHCRGNTGDDDSNVDEHGEPERACHGRTRGDASHFPSPRGTNANPNSRRVGHGTHARDAAADTAGNEQHGNASSRTNYTRAGGNGDEHTVNVDTNTGDHPGDHRGRDTGQEVLIAESLETVTYETDRECRVETGQWWAPHLGHHLGNPSHLDVDHHVPLKNAHLSGGWQWDADRKEEYANFLEDPDHLVAISSRHNRSKGARGPEEWAPPDNALWCQYATDWAEIKERWDLRMTEPEAEAVVEMLGTCEDPPVVEVEVWEALGATTGEHEPEPTDEPESSVYGSCEEAAAAGEQRVQGSQGGGEGFPKAMIPSARDGDGDGVVCEK